MGGEIEKLLKKYFQDENGEGGGAVVGVAADIVADEGHGFLEVFANGVAGDAEFRGSYVVGFAFQLAEFEDLFLLGG